MNPNTITLLRRPYTHTNKTRSTKTQIRALIDYMALYPAFANSELQGPDGVRRAEAHWQELRELLKQQGQDKSIEQWKQTWRDLKRKARTNYAESLAVSTATGNPNILVSEEIELILRIIGHESTLVNANDGGFGRLVAVSTAPIVALPAPSSDHEMLDNNGVSKSNGEENDGSDSDSNTLAKTFITIKKEPKSKRNSTTNDYSVKPKLLKSNNNIEFRLFGELVATQLSKMPLENAYRLQSQIQSFITEERLKTMNGSESFQEVYTKGDEQEWHDDSDG